MKCEHVDTPSFEPGRKHKRKVCELTLYTGTSFINSIIYPHHKG